MSIELPRVLENGAYTRRLHPISCSVSQSLTPLSTANLELPATDEIENLDWVQIFTPDGKSEYYRVSSVSTNTVTGDKSVYLEHGACTLGDILIPDVSQDVTPSSSRDTSHGANLKTYTENITDTISNLVTHILNQQPNPKRWTKGTIEATATIYIELGGSDLLSSLSTMMQYIPEYQMEFVQNSASNWVINIKQRPTTVICEGRLSRNLTSCDVSYDTSNLCTRVYADGIGYINSANISTYGVHEETQNLNDDLNTSQKTAIINSYLANRDHPTVSISISGIELSQITGLSIDQFTVGSVCRIAIPWLNLTEEEVILDKKYSDVYNAPEQVSLTLANATPDLVIAMAAITSRTGGRGGGLRGQQEQKEKEKKRYETRLEQTDRYLSLVATDTQWDELGNGTVTAYSTLTVSSEKIEGVVADIASSGYSSITQLAGSISLIVDADGVVTPAQLILAINDNNESTVKLEADQIQITGNTGILGALTVEGVVVSDDIFSSTGTLHDVYCETLTTDGNIYCDYDLIMSSTSDISTGTITAEGLVTCNYGLDVTGTASADSMETGTLYVDGVELNANAVKSFGTATESSGQISIPYYTFASGTRQAGTINFNIAATQFYIDAVAAAELRGWNAACDKITRVSNTIYGPQKNSYGNSEQKYRANYSSSSYSASSHSHSDAWMKIDGVPGTYRSDITVNLTSFSGNIQFNSGYDSYSPSSYSASSFSWTTY